MAADNTVSRSCDLGLATWFGGSLMGRSGSTGRGPGRGQATPAGGHHRLEPLDPGQALAGITAHVAGGLILLGANKGRVASQQSVGQATVAKTALTGAALAATAWSQALGTRLDEAGEIPVEGGTEPSRDTPQDIANAQRQLKVLQWVIPALTGAVLVLIAHMGEQQRPAQVTGGLLGRLRPGRAV